jgi:hypothetical protein
MLTSSLRLTPFLFPLLSSLLTVGCGSPEPEASKDQPTTPAITRDYHQDAKAVLDRYCVNCHQAGGIAPFSLSDYASAKAHAGAIHEEVEEGNMPPWLASDDSTEVRYSRKMRPEDKQVLLDWVHDGALEGDPAARSRITVPPADMPAPPRKDLLLDMGVAYQPNKNLSDDYRCFIIDPGPGGTGGLPTERFAQATAIIPGSAALVHHVIIFEVPASQVAAARNKDAAEAGPGYTCFGGPGVGGRKIEDQPQMITGWAPGGVPTRLQSDEGVLLRKGSVFVMQVHYNLSNFSGQTDRTVAHLELADKPPANQVLLVPIADPDRLKIPAGEKDASQTIVVPAQYILSALKLPGSELTIVSDAPHMHLLGKSIQTSIDGKPLIDIPAWDFHWQQSYFFQKPVVVRGNQSIFLECHYDNSAENQPFVNGMRQKPRDVSWGEGTFDEMCLTFLGIRFPRTTP